MAEIAKRPTSPDGGERTREIPKSAAGKAFQDLHSSIGSENWVFFESKEKGVEEFVMRVMEPSGTNDSYDKKGNLVIRYQKTMRTGEEDVVFGTNEWKIQNRRRLEEARLRLAEERQKGKLGNAETIRSYEESVRRFEKEDGKESPLVKVDLGQKTVEATMTYDPKSDTFYYEATINSGDGRIAKNEKGGLAIHRAFPGSHSNDQSIDVPISKEKALQILTRMKSEKDAALR